MTTETAELLSLLILEVNDLKTSVVVEMVTMQAQTDATAGFLHFMMAGIGLIVGLLTWLVAWSTRR